MKRMLGAMVVAMALMLGGCGGEVRVSASVPLEVPVVYAPAVTTMDFSLDAARQFVVGSVDFSDPDADLDTMTVVVTDSRGFEVARTVTDLRSFFGYTGGVISFSIDYIAYLPGTYDFTLYLTDRFGNLSNPVYGTFRIF